METMGILFRGENLQDRQIILQAFIEQLRRQAINASTGERQDGTYMGLLLFFVAEKNRQQKVTH